MYCVKSVLNSIEGKFIEALYECLHKVECALTEVSVGIYDEPSDEEMEWKRVENCISKTMRRDPLSVAAGEEFYFKVVNRDTLGADDIRWLVKENVMCVKDHRFELQSRRLDDEELTWVNQQDRYKNRIRRQPKNKKS